MTAKRKSRAEIDEEIVAKAGPWTSNSMSVYPARAIANEPLACKALARIANKLKRKGGKR